MGAQAAALAAQFTRANAAAIAAAASLDTAAWRRPTAAGPAIGVVFNDIAESYATNGHLIVQIVAGARPATQTQAETDTANDAAARLAQNVAQADVLQRLRQNGQMLESILNTLDDDTLLNAAPVVRDGPPLSVQQLIVQDVIAQIAAQLQSVRIALEGH